jgi:hypothetical protein
MSRNLIAMPLAWLLTTSLTSSLLAADIGQQKKNLLLNPAPQKLSTETLTCDNAPLLQCGAVVDSSNAGASNAVSQYGCVTFDESGGEVVYRLELTSFTEVDLRLTGMTADLDMFLLSACDASSCMRSSTGVSSERIVACIAPGTYYLVVDGFAGQTSDFRPEMFCTPCTPCAPAVPNDDCGAATKIPSYGETQILTGSTCCARDDYHGDSCTGFLALGLDVSYRVDLPPGCSIAATLRDGADGKNMDLSVYLVSSCFDPRGSCVAGSDSNTIGAESFSYTSEEGGSYYLMVDSFGNQSCGDYELEITFSACSSVAVDEKQWSHVKQLYR